MAHILLSQGSTMSRLQSVFALSAAFALAGSACASEPSSPSQPGEMAESELQRDRAPNVSTTDAEALVAGTTAFAVDAYRALHADNEGENLTWSSSFPTRGSSRPSTAA